MKHKREVGGWVGGGRSAATPGDHSPPLFFSFERLPLTARVEAASFLPPLSLFARFCLLSPSPSLRIVRGRCWPPPTTAIAALLLVSAAQVRARR